MEHMLASSVWSDWAASIGNAWSVLWPWIWSGFAWGSLALAIAMGLLGVFVPVIPGAIVFLVGAVVHKLMLPELLTWWGIGILGLLVVLDRVVDFFATAAGTKWFGGTKWGIFGALAGGLAGLFFGIVGVLIGPVVGAIVFELIWARRHPKSAAKSGLGAGLGFGLSVVGRMAVFFMMAGAVAIDVIYERPENDPEPRSAAVETALEQGSH